MTAAGALIVGALVAAPWGPADPVVRGFNLPLPRAAYREPVPAGTFLADVLAAASFGPSDVALSGRFGYRLPIFASTEPLFADNEVAVGVLPRLSLRGFGFGPFLEIQPASFFHFRASAELLQLFGWLDSMSSYSSPNAAYWTPSAPYGSGGGHVQLQPTVQIKLGPVSVRNQFSADLWNVAVRPDHRVFYEIGLDTLVARKGWVLTNTLDATYEARPDLTAGLRYVATAPLYATSDFPIPPSSTALADRNGHHRIGVLASWAPAFTLLGTRPVVAADVSFWVAHKYRAGAQSPAFLPRLWLGVVVPLADPLPQPDPPKPASP